MSLFVHLLADFIHLYMIIILCDMFFMFSRREHKHNKICLVTVGLVMALISLGIYVFNNNSVETIAYILAVMLLIYVLYSEEFYNVAIVSVCLIFVSSMTYTMIAVLFDILMDLLNISGEIFTDLGIPATSLLLVYLVGRIYKKNSTAGIKTIGVFNLLKFMVLMMVDTIVVTIIAVNNVMFSVERFRPLYLVAVALVVIGIFIQLAAVILLFMQRNVYKEKEQLTEKYLNEQKNHYEYLEDREKETKKFRHDLRNHMELISALVRIHEYEKIDNYLEQMQVKVDTLGNMVTVQNGTVDAIINQYYAKAKQQGITMEVQGRFPEECLIDIYDICTIFSNVLSNALEAAVRTEDKYISLECRYTDRNIIIVVKNSFINEYPGGKVQLKTRKSNADYHGYGLENMKDSINKYKGIFDIETSDNLFTLTILFNNVGK